MTTIELNHSSSTLTLRVNKGQGVRVGGEREMMVVCVCACFFQNYSTAMHEHDILLRRARADLGTSAQSPPLPPFDLSKASMVE